MSLDNAKNFIKLVVSGLYDSSAVSITVDDGSKLPVAPFNLVWYNYTDYKDPSDDPNVEIIRITNRVGNVLTITRGQESTIASNKNTANKVYRLILSPTAKLISDINEKFNSLEIDIYNTNETINDLDERITQTEQDIYDLDIRTTQNEGDISDLESSKQDNLGFTPENVANKKTGLSEDSDIYYPTQKAVNSALSGKQNSLGFTPENISNKSTNIIDDASSNDKYPGVKAIKDYTDGLVAGLLDYRGAYNASGNLWPSNGGSGSAGAILKGDMWFISVAGSLGGENVQIGDSIIANTDNPGQTASNWNILNTNISYVPEDSANKVTSLSGSSTDTQYPSAKLVYDQLQGKQPSGSYLTSSDIANLKNVNIGIYISGNGNPIQIGKYGGYIKIPFNGTIKGWNLYEGSSIPIATTTVLDVWKKSSFYPTVADTIFGTKPALSNATNNSATGLSIAVTAGDIIAFNVDSNNNAKELILQLSITKS